MAEGAVEQEGQPIISKLFPLSRDSVLTAFSELSPRENPSSAQLKTNEEKRILDEKNPHVSTYFSNFAQQMREGGASEEDTYQVSLGAIIGHRVLREEAESKGGVLPTFTKEFVKDFHNKDVERIRAMSADKKITDEQAEIQLGIMAIDMFKDWEVEFSEILKDKLGLQQSDWRSENDLVYLGIVEQYLLFREGCEDSKNFVQ